MEINTSNQVQGLEATPKASEAKHEKKEASSHQTTRTEDNPDYRISLSTTAKEAVTESTRSQAAGQAVPKSDLAEKEAARLAQQAAEQLAQTNASISNQAIQKAVDLFT